MPKGKKTAEQEYEELTEEFITEMDGVDASPADYREGCESAIERLRTCIQASKETDPDATDED